MDKILTYWFSGLLPYWVRYAEDIETIARIGGNTQNCMAVDLAVFGQTSQFVIAVRQIRDRQAPISKWEPQKMGLSQCFEDAQQWLKQFVLLGWLFSQHRAAVSMKPTKG
tara:strand:+ start:242 stop:571 length:330 start_codon:yes stop_codon:yes gene_type:complete